MNNRILCFLVLLISSCSSVDESAQTKNIFRYNESSGIHSFDPAFAKDQSRIWFCNQVYNSLVQLDDTLQVQASIAKRWSVSNNSLVYNFVLRDDVQFHKPLNRSLTIEDVVYSLTRLKSEETASPGAWVLSSMQSLVALNDSTLQIRLKEPNPAFLGLLTMRYCAVVPKEGITFYKDDFRSNPIGTGPFKFKKWEEDVKLVLRKNELYFELDQNGEQLPYLEAIAISFLPDIQSEFMMFIQGKFDFLNSLDTSYKDDLLTPLGALQEKYSQDIEMEKGPYLNTEYIGFYLDASNRAIKSKQIRKAMNVGFDREKMILFLRNTIGFPAFQDSFLRDFLDMEMQFLMNII